MLSTRLSTVHGLKDRAEVMTSFYLAPTSSKVHAAFLGFVSPHCQVPFLHLILPAWLLASDDSVVVISLGLAFISCLLACLYFVRMYSHLLVLYLFVSYNTVSLNSSHHRRRGKCAVYSSHFIFAFYCFPGVQVYYSNTCHVSFLLCLGLMLHCIPLTKLIFRLISVVINLHDVSCDFMR